MFSNAAPQPLVHSVKYQWKPSHCSTCKSSVHYSSSCKGKPKFDYNPIGSILVVVQGSTCVDIVSVSGPVLASHNSFDAISDTASDHIEVGIVNPNSASVNSSGSSPPVGLVGPSKLISTPSNPKGKDIDAGGTVDHRAMTNKK
ncbi:hypothetical protein Nepgr_032402 [Nepenthes gracilis]|uniref:Uncharacterized protein n=1 Tax=Nepenthes gracilis TaxID=150966 RepID=A0AAD3TK09_NEPGR|nr:hypothetical protein Nepgr_032402 [Nepenthes gracilis]